MEGNAIGYAKTEFLNNEFFVSGGSVGISVEMLCASFLGFPVLCGQSDNSNGEGYGIVLSCICWAFGLALKKLIGSSDMVQNRNCVE